MQIQISGLELVQKRLAALPRKIVDAGLAKALDRGIGVVAAAVEARTPPGENEELVEAMITKVKIDPDHQGGESVLGYSSRASERTGKPMDSIALWVEYGHRMVSHSGKPTGHVPAHPFIRPAFEESAERAIGAFADTLLESLSAAEEPQS